MNVIVSKRYQPRYMEVALSSVELFTKLFFAFDQINYARLTPVYLSEMFALKRNDPNKWNFFKMGISLLTKALRCL